MCTFVRSTGAFGLKPALPALPGGAPEFRIVIEIGWVCPNDSKKASARHQGQVEPLQCDRLPMLFGLIAALAGHDKIPNPVLV